MPKFGNHSPADVWAETTRTLTDISMEEVMDLPELDSGYSGGAPTSSATLHTFGSWVELVADVGVGKRLIGVAATFASATAIVGAAEIEIGEGESGSESAITRVGMYMRMLNTLGPNQNYYLPAFRSLTDNARLAVRVKDNQAAAIAYGVVPLIA